MRRPKIVRMKADTKEKKKKDECYELLSKWIDGKISLENQKVHVMIAFINDKLNYKPDFSLPFYPYHISDVMSFVSPEIFLEIGEILEKRH